MFLHTWHPSPILLSVGSVHIYWYGACLAIGALAGLFVILSLGRRYQLDRNFLYDYFVSIVIGGFVGGRIYHVLNEWNYYRHHLGDSFRVWNGGLAIHGAMIAGLLILIYLARKYKLNAWLLADITVVGLAIGQALGRWGNYFNQELFGRPTSQPWGIPIDLTHRPLNYLTASYFQPTFLFESLGCLLIFGGLFWILIRRHKNSLPRWLRGLNGTGTIALLYFILYSLLRIGMESLRTDSVPIIFNIRLPLITSGLIIIAALAIWIVRTRHQATSGTPNRSTT